MAQLKSDYDKRKFRHHPDKLNATFVNIDTYEVVKKVRRFDSDPSSEPSIDHSSVDSMEFSGDHLGQSHGTLNEAKSSIDLDLTMLERMVEAEEGETVVHVEPSAPVFRKPLDKLLDNKSLKKRTQENYNYVKTVSSSNGISVAQLLGHLLHRHYYNSNKRLASLGQALFKGETDIGSLASVDALRGLHILSRYLK